MVHWISPQRVLGLWLLLPGYSMAQDMIALPRHGSGGIITSCYGTVTDDGGDSNYTDTCNGYITIAPGWAASVSLHFEEFHLEPVFDYVKIYDGPGLGFPLIGQYSGTELQGQTITSTSGYITLQQVTDDIVNESGFRAVWTCLLGEEENSETVVHIFPNPVHHMLIAEIPGEPFQADLSDLSGRCVWQSGMTADIHQISMECLPAGMYLLYLRRQQNEPVLIRKIMKQ